MKSLFFIWLFPLFVPIPIDNFFFYFTILFSLILIFDKIRRNQIILSSIHWLYFIFIGYLSIQFFFVKDYTTYFYYYQKYIEGILIFFIISNYLKAYEIDYYMSKILYLVFFSFLIGIIQYFLGYGKEYLAFHSIGNYEYFRRPIISGFDPNYYYLHIIGPLCFCMNNISKNSKDRFFNLLFILILTLNAYLTASKSAFIITFLIYIYYLLRPSTKKIITLVVILLFFMIFYPFLEYISPYTQFRLNSLFINDFQVITTNRNILWFSSLQIFFENPFLGLGLGEIVSIYSRDSYLFSIGAQTTHNTFIHSLAELGLFGTIFLFLPLFKILRDSYINNSYFFPILLFSIIMLNTIDAAWYKQIFVYLSFAYIHNMDILSKKY